jgi:hypothetical protein
LVTVGVGVACGRGGSTESLGLTRGCTVTTPTTPSELKSTNGRTSALLVSALDDVSSRTMVPIGTPGT